VRELFRGHLLRNSHWEASAGDCPGGLYAAFRIAELHHINAVSRGRLDDVEVIGTAVGNRR